MKRWSSEQRQHKHTAEPRKMETGSAHRPGEAASHAETELEGKERKVILWLELDFGRLGCAWPQILAWMCVLGCSWGFVLLGGALLVLWSLHITGSGR